jgi:hypothetical protein
MDCIYGSGDCRCDPSARTWSCRLECPASAPSDGSGCNGVSGSCNYGLQDCSCQSGKWTCQTCNTTPPANASQCAQPGQECVYADRQCWCSNDWSCTGICPAAMPADGSACSAIQADLPCDYASPDSTRCTCDALGDTWSCKTCPATAPNDGDACMGFPIRDCAYAATTCFCGGASWSCRPT